MKLGLKLEYACRAVLRLATCYDGQRVCRVEDLAAQEGISANFLVQILNDLRRDGLVASRRGKLGGYTLARPPAEINLADVTRAIEGGVLEIDRAESREGFGPVVARVWREEGRHLEQRLAQRTLAELSAGSTGLDYTI